MPDRTFINMHAADPLDSNNHNANKNYSDGGLGSRDFIIAPPANEVYELARVLVYIEDTVGVSAEKYGNITAGLTNGITFIHKNGGVEYDLMDGDVIKSNADWARECYDAQLLAWGSGNQMVTVRWTFSKSGIPIKLEGDQGDQLIVRINDDLSGLVAHYFRFQGTKYTRR